MRPEEAEPGATFSGSEVRLVEAARRIATGNAIKPDGYPLGIEAQERILLLAAEIGAIAESYMEKGVKAQRAVNAWWTPERMARLGGVSLRRRPKLEDIIRDLLPHVLPQPELTDESSPEQVAAALADTFFVLHAPSILSTFEILTGYLVAAKAGRREAADLDSFEGVALILAPNLRRARPRGRRPPADFDRRKFDEFSLLSYRTHHADAQHKRSVRYALAWLAAQRRRAKDHHPVTPSDFSEAATLLTKLRGPSWANRPRLGAAGPSLEEEAALSWLAEERKRVGDPRPVTDSDAERAVKAVRSMMKRVHARRARKVEKLT